MSAYHQALLTGETYHLFSRAVGNEKLFLSDRNYFFFLQKLKQHTTNVCDLYSYSLLPNHFHLLVRIKDENIVVDNYKKVKNKQFNPNEDCLPDFIMERFSNFLNSYAKAFNKTYNRKGGLFMDYMKRSIVNTDCDFTSYVWYIHKNAVHHQITKNIGEWQHDSYRPILSSAASGLLRDEVIGWFGGRNEYIKFHQQPVSLKNRITYKVSKTL